MFIIPSAPTSCTQSRMPFLSGRMAASDDVGNSFKENSLEVGAGPHQLYSEDPRRNLPIRY